MKTIACIITILTFTGLNIFSQGKAAVTDTAKDDAAIRANVEQMVKGWNAKSGAEFSKPFALDADYVVINGAHIKGRPAIIDGHDHIFATFLKTSILASTVDTIRYLRPDVALVHLRSSLTMAGNPSTEEATISLVMIKNKGVWEIAAFQNTAVDARGGH